MPTSNFRSFKKQIEAEIKAARDLEKRMSDAATELTQQIAALSGLLSAMDAIQSVTKTSATKGGTRGRGRNAGGRATGKTRGRPRKATKKAKVAKKKVGRPKKATKKATKASGQGRGRPRSDATMAVLEVLAEAAGPMSPIEIEKALKKRKVRASRAGITQTLMRLPEVKKQGRGQYEMKAVARRKYSK